MSEVNSEALDLIYGRWRSQILYAGVELASLIISPVILRSSPRLWQQNFMSMHRSFIG